MSILCTISSSSVKKVGFDAICAPVAALSTDRVFNFDIVVRFALLLLPWTFRIVALIVETGVERFAAHLDEVGATPALAHCYFASCFVLLALDNSGISETITHVTGNASLAA